MSLWGALIALLHPGVLDPAPGHLMLGLAVVVGALLVAAAVALPTPAASTVPGRRLLARHTRVVVLPRLLDPGAAGRPRPRAPSGHPATA
jgi:hypothetical protein